VNLKHFIRLSSCLLNVCFDGREENEVEKRKNARMFWMRQEEENVGGLMEFDGVVGTRVLCV
jgi:hypothetical protein